LKTKKATTKNLKCRIVRGTAGPTQQRCSVTEIIITMFINESCVCPKGDELQALYIHNDSIDAEDKLLYRPMRNKCLRRVNDK